jgi:aldose 1-epimerase
LSVLRLHNAWLEAVVLPETGGALASFNWIGTDGPLPLMRSLPAGVSAPRPNRLACYPLVPWSNRIGHGRFWKTHRRGWRAANTISDPVTLQVADT